jgi:hypothetical protein
MKRLHPETWAALCVLVAGILVAVSAAAGLVGLELGPHWLSDQSLLERSFSTALPGLAQPRVLAREPGTTATDRRLRFEVAVAVADGGRRLCQGLLIYHHRPTPATDLVWDDPLCAEAVAHPRRPRTQPEKHRPGDPPRQAGRHHRPVRLGQVVLAFDTIYAEGQRRYVESLSAYARQFLGLMEKPDVDQIEGLSPAISIDQKGASA